MTEAEIFKAASLDLYIMAYEYETKRACEEVLGKDKYLQEVWDLVLEAQEKGLIWFREQAHNKGFKIYPV